MRRASPHRTVLTRIAAHQPLNALRKLRNRIAHPGGDRLDFARRADVGRAPQPRSRAAGRVELGDGRRRLRGCGARRRTEFDLRCPRPTRPPRRRWRLTSGDFNRTADDLNDLIAQAARKRSSATVLLEHIVAAELEDKQRRSVESRLTRARLGRFKPFADWDWQWPTALDRPALERILTLDFLVRGENVILVGAHDPAS